MTDTSRKVNRRFPIAAIVLIAFSAFVCLIVGGSVLMIFFWGFLSPNDSWWRYVGGGSYSCNAGSLSPCGEYLVFGSPKSGHGDLWRLRLEDSSMTRMTVSDAFESDPQYSPDGESIFYHYELGGNRHIWKTDKNGQVHEQLTPTFLTPTFRERTIHTLVDVSPDGEHLIISRSYYAGGKGMVVIPATIFSVSNQKFADWAIGLRGLFLDNQTVLCSQGTVIPRFGTLDLETQHIDFFGDGYIECLSPNKKLALISRDPKRSFFEKELVVFDLEEQTETRIGTGMNPCFLGNLKVVFSVHPFRNKLYVYSLENGTTKEFELPGAMLTTPIAASGDRGVLLGLSSPNDADRSGNIYLFHNERSIKKLTQ